MKIRSIVHRVLQFIASICILLLFWHLNVLLFKPEPYLLPAPSVVINTLFVDINIFYDASKVTFANALVGGLGGVLLGLMIGAFCAYSKYARWIIEPYLTIFQSFPRESFFPIMVVWLGFGDMPKIVNAGLLCTFPMAIITLDALLNTQTEYTKLMRSWSASKFQTFWYCQLPDAMPTIVGGIRVAAPLALIGAVLGEFLGGNEGLGHIIVSSGSAFRIDRAFSAIIILALGGVTIVACIDLLRHVFLKRFFQNKDAYK